MAKNWIADATQNKGALTRQAKRAGMTPAEYCNQPKGQLSKLAQKRCQLRETLMKMR